MSNDNESGPSHRHDEDPEPEVAHLDISQGGDDSDNDGHEEDKDSDGSDFGDGEDEDADDEDFSGSSFSEPDEENAIEATFQNSISTSNERCMCFSPHDKDSGVTLMSDMLSLDFNTNTAGCFIDNIVRCYNKIYQEDEGEASTVHKIAFADFYYRLRHEMLFKMLCWAYNLPVQKSDMSFRDFGIDSDRTPDLIYKLGEVLYIIEVTAVGSMERGAQSKGVEDLGFESKYAREISLLNDNKIKNKYLPVVFNMNDPNQPCSPELMNEFDSTFIKSNDMSRFLTAKAKTFCHLNEDIKVNLSLPSTLLFTKRLDIVASHPRHKFLYDISNKSNVDKAYNQAVISPPVYKVVNLKWGGIYNNLARLEIPDNSKVILILDVTQNNRFTVEKDPKSSYTMSDITDCLQNNDKLGFFKKLKLKTQTGVYESTISERGIKYYIRSNKGKTSSADVRIFIEVETFNSHTCSAFTGSRVDVSLYSKYIDQNEQMFLNSKFYKSDYEDLILDKLEEFDMSSGLEEISHLPLLSNMETKEIDIDSIMEKVRERYMIKNSIKEQIPVKVFKMKSPFILPIAKVNSSSYCKLSDKNPEFINNVLSNVERLAPLTSKVLRGCLKESYKFFSKPKQPSSTLAKLYNDRLRLSNSINKLQREVYKKGTSDGQIKLSKTSDPNFKPDFDAFKSEMVGVNKRIKDRQVLENVKRHIDFIRLPSKGKNSLNYADKMFEMEHFKNKKVQSTIEGVGIRNGIEKDFESEKEVFNAINEQMVNYCGVNDDVLIDEYVSKDAKLLEDLKKMALSNYRNLINQVKNSQLGHSSALISRLAHSLMYYSQLPFSSDYYRVDNLGYNDVLLIVRGGKKIFKSKSSKLYRLVYPMIEETVPWYTEGRDNKGSNIIFSYKGCSYCMTPWSMLHESILTDSISFYPRVCSFAILNLKQNISLEDQYSRVSLNILLAFHNRRQTEVLLSNMRYILLSTLGDFTGMSEILPEFFSFNYDCFQSYIRNSILINYPRYFKTLVDLKRIKKDGKDITINDYRLSSLRNLFTDELLTNTEDLTMMIYSTYLMTKAPYQKISERANNLLGILKIHEQYEKEVGLHITPEEQLLKTSVYLKPEQSYGKYADNLFSKDFNFDPYYCGLVGSFANDELSHNLSKEEVHNAWYKILDSSWDEMATSTGLRGDYNDIENFWGQKGYFVVYKRLLDDKTFRDNMKDLFLSDSTADEKRRRMRKINETFLQKTKEDREFLLFHAVDKVQWKGGREIYVMDITTKLLQQPIEKFMGYICKNLDNELISVPSDKRSQVIHHAIFEKDMPTTDTLTWYLTLDCTKWAPKSLFSKFIITILPMEILPNSFKIHFMNYCEKLFFKRIYFNKAEVEVLKNNEKYRSKVERFLTYDEQHNGYYLLMPYSWVMGIFNYTSSFLHAMNQKYFSYLLQRSTQRSYREEVSLYMFAHSDDSGGRLTVPDFQHAKRAVALYEINLKCCNHLLSKKKSVISRIYFEILSIIYMFKQLLALLPKFLGGLRFLPTDKGPCQDMSQSYSKAIEVVIAGADFSVSYLVMKIYSMIVWRFYYNQTPTETDYLRPVQQMGLPDAHPLMLLLCGSDADIVRIYSQDKPSLEKTMLFSECLINPIDEPKPIKPYKFEIKIKNLKTDFQCYIEEFKDLLDKWSIRNVNYHNTAFNCLSFLNKLRDSGFVGALVNESITRRFSRSYFMRHNSTLMTKWGNMRLEEVLELNRLFCGFSDESSSVRFILENLLSTEEIEEIIGNFDTKRPLVQNSIDTIREVLYSPLKLYKYLNQLKMENRPINFQPRTLKPTVLQLIKSNNVFSAKFDPPSLVSFIKEPELSWAIPDVRGLLTTQQELETIMERRGLSLTESGPDNLLNICRDFGPNSVKTIYLYSRVPTELRQIRNYSSFLTFLSVNSFDGMEIGGLTIRLTGKEMETGYTLQSVNEEVYDICNCLSVLAVLFEKTSMELFETLSINPMEEVNWSGGKITDFVFNIESNLKDDIYACFFRPQLEYLKVTLGRGSRNAEFLNKCAYYTFLKSQRVKKGWYGKGELYINIENTFYSLNLYNNTIVSVTTNNSGKVLPHHSDFIKDVCDHLSIGLTNLPPKRKNEGDSNLLKSYFGFDYSGHLTCSNLREMTSGIPCLIKSHRNEFVNELYNYNIVNLTGDCMTLRCDIFESQVVKKVYLIPVRRQDIVTQIIKMLDPNDFKKYLFENGLNDFEDFVYTEILTEYGGENYVNFNEMMDNYPSSKLFEIMRKCKKESITQINKTPVYSNFPASNGSLTKILIDYGESTGDIIINVNKNLSPEIMQIRSEYSDQMGVILSEKLVEFYSKVYSKEERREISDSYHKLSRSSDTVVVRNEIIKLMTYWGYGSLVQGIQEFSLVRKSSNFDYFNLTLTSESTKHNYAKLYVFLINSLNDELRDWSSQYDSLPFKNTRLKNRGGMNTVINNYIRFLCISCYGYKSLFTMVEVCNLQYHAVICSILQDENFCSSLQLRLSTNYILGCLPISYKDRENFLVLLNNLKHVWLSCNSVDYKITFHEKNKMLPVDVPNWKSISRQFKADIPPAWTYYSGGVSSEFVHSISSNRKSSITISDKEYRINNKVVPLSNNSIPLHNMLLFPRPLKEAVFESESWEIVLDEAGVSDNDEALEDSINELKEEIGGSLYSYKTTKEMSVGGRKIIRGTVKWVFMPMSTFIYENKRRLRQSGENLVVVTTVFTDGMGSFLKNCKRRYLELSTGECLYLYISLQNELNNDGFINKLVCKTDMAINSGDIDYYCVSKYRDFDGKIKTEGFGVYFTKELLEGESESKIQDGKTVIVKKSNEGDLTSGDVGSTSSVSEDKSQLELKKEVYLKIDTLVDEGLSESTCNHLKQKYLSVIENYGMRRDIVMESLLRESDLNCLKEGLSSGSINLSDTEYKESFLAPKNFNCAYNVNSVDDRSIKNKNVKAEIESFDEEMSSRIGSGYLCLSSGFKSVIDAYYQMWRNTLKVTKHKRENKAYLMSVFTSMLSSAKTGQRVSNKHDHIWQAMSNKISLYMASEIEDEDDFDPMDFIMSTEPFSRLKYKPKGF